MERKLTKREVLKQCGITYDMSNLTKGNTIKLVSKLDKVDPEVAREIINQFPDFSASMREIIQDYKEKLDRAYNENAASVKSVYASCDSVLNSLQNCLEKEHLSFEERQYIIENMIEIINIKSQKDSENKNFIKALTLGTVIIGAVAGATLGIAYGVDLQVGKNGGVQDGKKGLSGPKDNAIKSILPPK